MNVINSIIARYRNYKIAHFDQFEGRKLKSYKNIHLGKRCFIIGNGPSLRASDLDIIHSKGEISFAFNRIFHIFPETRWRPTYYLSQDVKMLAGSVEEINRITASKFIPIEMDWYYNIHVDNAISFHLLTKDFENIAFSTDIPKFLYNTNTVVFTAIQIAFYMGIKDIYLIGVDHHFRISKTTKGDVVVDPTAKDYFSDLYNKDSDKLYIPNMDLSTLAYVAAKKFSEQYGFKVYNATRGGKLEVFERRNFDELF